LPALWDEGRDLLLYLVRQQGGMKLRELAEAAGRLDYTSVTVAVARFSQRLERNSTLAARVKQAETKLKNAKI
jgi:chromosomal replication initiation ATPase DnaA